jgi:hypothetical protein
MTAGSGYRSVTMAWGSRQNWDLEGAESLSLWLVPMLTNSVTGHSNWAKAIK